VKKVGTQEMGDAIVKELDGWPDLSIGVDRPVHRRRERGDLTRREIATARMSNPACRQRARAKPSRWLTLGAASPARPPQGQGDTVLVAAIDQDGHLAAVDDIDPAAEQREACAVRSLTAGHNRCGRRTMA